LPKALSGKRLNRLQKENERLRSLRKQSICQSILAGASAHQSIWVAQQSIWVAKPLLDCPPNLVIPTDGRNLLVAGTTSLASPLRLTASLLMAALQFAEKLAFGWRSAFTVFGKMQFCKPF
jgi:hypothetical protein